MKTPEDGLQILRKEEDFNASSKYPIIKEGYGNRYKLSKKQKKNLDFLPPFNFTRNVFFLAPKFFII